MSRCLLSTTTTYRLFRPEAQIWAPVPLRRQCPAGAGPQCSAGAGPLGRRRRRTSGPAPMRLLSYDAVTVGRAQTRPCRGATMEGVPARKSMSVAYRREYKKVYSSFRRTGRGNGATGVHRAFSDGYQGKSIEHSQMDPTEGSREGGTRRPTVPCRPFRAFPDGHQSRAHRAFSNGPHRGKQEHKMHPETVCEARKLTCLLCACDRDFQSNYRRRTSKKTNVSFNKTQI